MTSEQKIEMVTMRARGATYQAIADKFGISRQRAQVIVESCIRVGNRACPPSRVIYPALRTFILEHCGGSVSAFSDLCGVSKLNRILSGIGNPSAKTIQKMLDATGMKYEEAFRMEEGTP